MAVATLTSAELEVGLDFSSEVEWLIAEEEWALVKAGTTDQSRVLLTTIVAGIGLHECQQTVDSIAVSIKPREIQVLDGRPAIIWGVTKDCRKEMKMRTGIRKAVMEMTTSKTHGIQAKMMSKITGRLDLKMKMISVKIEMNPNQQIIHKTMTSNHHPIIKKNHHIIKSNNERNSSSVQSLNQQSPNKNTWPIRQQLKFQKNSKKQIRAVEIRHL